MTSNDEPVVCIRCGDDTFRIFEREVDGPFLIECVCCGYRSFLRRADDPVVSGESGRCISCGSYFEAEAGLSSQVCSRRCDRALVAEFNGLVR